MALVSGENDEEHGTPTQETKFHRDESSEKDIAQIPGPRAMISDMKVSEGMPAASDTYPGTRPVEQPTTSAANPRGLFGRFSILTEVEEPQRDYSRSTKWFITFVVAVAAAGAPLGSAILYRKREPFWKRARCH